MTFVRNQTDCKSVKIACDKMAACDDVLDAAVRHVFFHNISMFLAVEQAGGQPHPPP